jgi:HD superfamily phosphohydrolase YqeK
MDHTFCPGAKLLRQPKPEIYTCPTCGGEVEIWTDEIRGYCSNCKKAVLKDTSTSCLDWCQYGKDCVGEEVYSKYMENKASSLKRKLLEDLEQFFGEDTERIDHAKDVLEFAEELLKEETADWHVVVPAAILHDVGIKPAEEKYGSSEASYQEAEGPPVAEKILFKRGLKTEDVQEICDIIGHHHTPRENETTNFRVVFDADCLVNLRRKVDGKTREEREELIDSTFLTAAGKRMAKRLFLS